jgi:hypothetical protein
MSITLMSLEICKEGLQNKVEGAMVPWTLTTPTHYKNITKLSLIIVGLKLPIVGLIFCWRLNVAMFIKT